MFTLFLQDIQQLLQLQQLVLMPGHPLQSPAQFLLSQSGQAQQTQQSEHNTKTSHSHYRLTLDMSLTADESNVLCATGLLSSPNLIQLPQQSPGGLMTSPPRMGLQAQVRFI